MYEDQLKRLLHIRTSIINLLWISGHLPYDVSIVYPIHTFIVNHYTYYGGPQALKNCSVVSEPNAFQSVLM